ncbi:proline-rich protein 23A-like [Dipodomys spectabilis]|uniref:proline-rich protein 23A-like n=1 Tax=Dipodomys spectabilis TaxID=105255 RepID=UPI001C53A647|nr:proline-rich protein 23A-like [Dipodomys spectabilis]
MGARPAPGWGPRPAKRRRRDRPSQEDPSKETPAHADGQVGLTALVVLAAGCGLQVPVGGRVELVVLEPAPVLTVDLQGRRLILIPQDLLGLIDQRPGQPGVSARDDRAPPDARAEDGTAPRGCGPVPEVAGREEAYAAEEEEEEEAEAQDAAPPHLPEPSRPSPGPGHPSPPPQGSSTAPTPDPDSRGAQSVFFHLPRSAPGSPLQPLPASPSPSSNPTRRPSLPQRPARKARRRLFQE